MRVVFIKVLKNTLNEWVFGLVLSLKNILYTFKKVFKCGSIGSEWFKMIWVFKINYSSKVKDNKKNRSYYKNIKKNLNRECRISDWDNIG
jgi:hypothetical protein